MALNRGRAGDGEVAVMLLVVRVVNGRKGWYEQRA
jgi:hypothetical protein